MVTHMARMMRMTPEEAAAFVAMNQSVLEPFLHGIFPPPHPPNPPTPKALMVPPRYYNLSLEVPNYNLINSIEFPLSPLIPSVPSPIEIHISYPPSPIHHPDNDLDEFPNGNWLSNPPSPTSPTDNSDHAPILQAFIETMDDPVEAQVMDTNLVQDMALVLYEGSRQPDVARMNASAD